MEYQERGPTKEEQEAAKMQEAVIHDGMRKTLDVLEQMGIPEHVGLTLLLLHTAGECVRLLDDASRERCLEAFSHIWQFGGETVVSYVPPGGPPKIN